MSKARKPYGLGPKAARAVRREAAEARNALTAPEHRAAYRRDPATRLLVDVFADPAKSGADQ